jgi:hypothetical protein
MAYQDLLKDTSEIKEDGNYFLVTVTDLEPAETYPIQFRWQYKDKTFSEWSSVKKLVLPGESGVPVPYIFSGDFKTAPGKIIIYWNGKDSNNVDMVGVDRVNIYLEDADDTFGDGSDPVAFFKVKGTVSIAVPAGTYNVTLRSVTTRGTLSNSTSPVTLTVEDGTPIEAPTLPTGLSASAAPFALTVAWTGAYASQTFSGFKAINIYASTTDLGSNTTTNLSTKLVGSMTVDQTSNKITIGLDVLKQVLSLTSQQAYDSSIYLYYLAVNANGIPYQVSGTTTYTRINSTAIAPTKANLIDLTNGLISIENLVAGNGQFQSWLRTGTAGSSRIELSSANVNSTEAGGYAVLSGLTVYNSANSPVFRADLAGNVAFGGYTPGDIDSISSTASGAQSTATGAASTAGEALTLAGTANDRTKNTFNSDGSAINRAVQLASGLGAIYSNKPSWESSNTGWYLGYNGTTPVIDIGSTDNYVRWDGTALSVKGVVNATGGSFGSSTTKWEIGSSGITATGNALIDMGTTGALELGDFSLTASGTVLVLTESGTTRKIIETDNAGSNGRIFLGYEDGLNSRQVQVRKSAQVAGTETTNSGGLRNMFTISEGNFAEASKNIYYTSAENGAVLLVWDQNS